ncbi:MAG: maleylpyruvate isomerase N-terminal domain-containing protein [Nocardioides sp.]
MSKPGPVRTSRNPGLDLVGGFAEAAGRFAASVAEADMHDPVPGCPPWSTYDLVVHLGNVHAWAATIVENGSAAVEQNDEPRSHRPRLVSEWYAGKAEDLHEVLRSTDPARPCWNFASGQGMAGFWHRRQLHETTIHTIDIDSVTHRTRTIAAVLAEDGIDEVLRVWLPRMHHRRHPATLSAPLVITTTDTSRAWTLTPRPVRPTPDAAVPTQPRGPVRGAPESAPARTEGPPLVIDRRHPRADLVTGPAEAIYRVLWKRWPADRLELSGDVGRIEAFLGSPLVP